VTEVVPVARKSRRKRAKPQVEHAVPPQQSVFAELRAQQRHLLEIEGQLQDRSEELIALRLDRDRWIARTRMLQGQIEYAFLRDRAGAAAGGLRRSSTLEALWLSYFPSDLWIDLRELPLGKNWYPAEPDGCWMASGESAEINLVRMPPGSYRVELEIVGATFDPDKDPVGVKIFSKALQVSVTSLEENTPYPRILYGNFNLGEEESEVPLVLTIVPPTGVVASSFAADDRRALSLRIRTVRFLRCSGAGVPDV